MTSVGPQRSIVATNMRGHPSSFGALLVAVSALAACSGNNSTARPYPTPTAFPCALPSGTQVALAYPISGATAVPDSPGQVVIAASPALPNTWQVVLQFPVGLAGEGLFNTIPPSAVPTPYATPSFASPTYQSSGLTQALPSATVVNVLLNNQGSTCTTFPQIGSFTTQ
jgi:hypothetical protein